MLVDATKLIDIYDFWYETVWFSSIIVWIMVGVLLVIFLIGTFYFYRYWIGIKAKVDCSILAYRQLSGFDSFHIVTLRDGKDCYFRLSLILKNYITLRCGLACYHATDSQMLEIIKQLEKLSDQDYSYMYIFLESMASIKFDQKIPSQQQFAHDIACVKKFIGMTTDYYSKQKEKKIALSI